MVDKLTSKVFDFERKSSFVQHTFGGIQVNIGCRRSRLFSVKKRIIERSRGIKGRNGYLKDGLDYERRGFLLNESLTY